MSIPVRWSLLPSLTPIARLVGMAPADLAIEVAGFPEGIYGVAMLRGEEPVAAGLLVEPRVNPDGSAALAWLGAQPDAGAELVALLDWFEATVPPLGATSLGVSVRSAPAAAALLTTRGYHVANAMIRMEPGTLRPPGPLPTGLAERTLKDVGPGAWMIIANEAFAEVPFGVQSTLEEVERLVAMPGFDPTLLRFICDAQGPVAYFRGVLWAEGGGEVEAVGTLRRARGQGLGRWALRRGAELLHARGASPVFLQVAETNVRAHGLYVSEGWAEVSRRVVWERALTPL